MRYILNPSRPRVYEIKWESDGKTLAEPDKVEANSPFDALQWWLSCFDTDKFAAMQDVEMDFSTGLLNSFTVWLGEEEIIVRDITEFEIGKEDCISCDQLIADRRAERKRKKAERQAAREAEQAEAKKALNTNNALAQLHKLQEQMLSVQTDLDLSVPDYFNDILQEDELG